MFIVLLSLSIFLFFNLKNIVYKPIDSNLLSKAKMLDDMINGSVFHFSFSDINGNRFQLNFSNGNMWIYSSKYSKYFFQIRSFDGKVIEKSISLGNISLPFKKKFNRCYTVYTNNKAFRLLNYEDKKNRLIIQVAYDAESENNILYKFSLIILLYILFIMIASAISGFMVSKKALEPLDEMRSEIKNISEHNLNKKIEMKDIPKELQMLVLSFNRMLDRLDSSFKQQKQFISDVSHELKTPVSVIMMQSDIILRKKHTEEEYKNAIYTIKNTTYMMSGLIEKMLFIARLDSKYNKISFEKVILNDIVQDAVNLLKHSARDKNIFISFNNTETYSVNGDRTMLLEVFINLIDNAIKYNKENGNVDIDISKDEDFIVVKIKDSGIGISEKDIDNIDKEFYRVDESRSKQTEGFGLGLSIVKKIIKIHNGRMTIKSQLGIGTEVAVYLKKA